MRTLRKKWLLALLASLLGLATLAGTDCGDDNDFSVDFDKPLIQ